MFKRPPRFPSVATVVQPEDDTAEQDAVRNWWATLEWFRNPFPSRPSKPLDEYSMEELVDLEADAVTHLLQAHAALQAPRYQPLSFKRTMRPEKYTSFGVLRDRETNEYVLAVVLGGRKSLQRSSISTQEVHDKERIFKGVDRFTPQVGENLEFFNAPISFRPPSDASILLFSLQYDAASYHQKYLQPLWERIQAASIVPLPLDAEIANVKDDEDPIGGCEEDNHTEPLSDVQDITLESLSDSQPQRKRGKRSFIGSARVTCSWNKDETPKFFLHLPIPVFEAAPPQFPETVLGIHEHDTGYSYAVISFEGSLIATGDLAIEQSVLPRIGDRTYNPNYANEVAVAILELAKAHNAYIGIEETSQFRQTSVSRTRNRRFFGRPSKRIATIITYKALEYGVLLPRMVWKVSPSRDCSQCGNRLEQGTSGIRRVVYVVCPMCGRRQPFKKDEAFVQSCDGCDCLWRANEGCIEREFVCVRCHGSPLVARTNTATVVALKTLQGIVEYFEQMSIRDRCDDEDLDV